MGSAPPPATLMSSRRDYLAKNPDVARRFLRAIADANEAYARAPADMTSLIQLWGKRAAPIANKPVGYISADIPGRGAETYEEPLGDVVSDAQLEAMAP